ncbi:ABC transporter ATP-binding protein [Clostridium butyricum]|uniref:ABC transporter ATP-binding protein n=1 Tax=Clostridium butyricum TaxID=1492 RepID=UPI0032BF2AA4
MENIILELKDLKKSFGSKQVLKGVDLQVKRGEIIGYIGSNGAGKSTTIKIILGTVDGYEGETIIFGQNIKNTKGEYKKKIGYVPEVSDVYESLTAKEYLNFIGELYDLGVENSTRKAKELMGQFGIENYLNTRISAFSKGMRQKLILISALIHNPEILFLDEPLSGLDANSVMIVKELLEILAKEGKTIFYSSHIMDVVEKISHRIVLLNEGKIVADGSFKELKENCNEGSLEEIFNDITGFNNHKEIAQEIARIIK